MIRLATWYYAFWHGLLSLGVFLVIPLWVVYDLFEDYKHHNWLAIEATAIGVGIGLFLCSGPLTWLYLKHKESA